MITQLLIFLPCLACVVWLITFLQLGRSAKSFGRISLLLLASVVYFYTDACYEFRGTTYAALSVSELLGQFIAPCMLPLLWLYLNAMKKETPNIILSIFWLVIPVSLCVIALMLFVLMGSENFDAYLQAYDSLRQAPIGNDPIYKMLRIMTSYVFRGVLLAEVLVLLGQLIKDFSKSKVSFGEFIDFLKGKGRISPLFIQLVNTCFILVICVLRIVLTRGYLLDRQWIAALLGAVTTLILCSTCFFALFCDFTSISLRKVRRTFIESESLSYDVESDEDDEVQAAMIEVKEDEERIAEQVATDEAKPMDAEQNDSLLGRFEDYIINQQKFLVPGLTINDIARELGSNKTYISRLVNTNYRMTFPDYLNSLKIDYAEQYILHHRNAKQNEIAEACGFPNASSFNNTFKKITGVTPRIWLVTHSDSE